MLELKANYFKKNPKKKEIVLIYFLLFHFIFKPGFASEVLLLAPPLKLWRYAVGEGFRMRWY